MNSRTLLINNQSAILNLQAGLTFATDQEAQKAILNRFALANMIWRDPAIMALRIQQRADQIRPVIEEIYKTTQYQYNPIDNYDRHEEYVDSEVSSDSSKTSRSASGRSNTSFNNTDGGSVTSQEFPMANSGNPRNVSKNINDSSGSGSTSGTSSDTESGSASEQGSKRVTHTAHLWGNIGVTTTMDMIKQQREILINVLDEFAKRFADLFIYEL